MTAFRGLLGPGVEGPGQGAALLLEGEVYDHGGPARSGGLSAGHPVVGGHGAAEGHVHVGVRVYKPRHHELAGGVHLLGAVRVEPGTDGNYLLILDQHVGSVAAGGGNDRSAAKE